VVEYRPEDDHYVTLQVAATATTDDIKRAHRALIRECHPDKVTGDHDRATRLNHARDVLLDPDQRAAYDDARLQQRAAKIQRPKTARRKRRYGRTRSRKSAPTWTASQFSTEVSAPPRNPVDVTAELIAAIKNRRWAQAAILGLLKLAAVQNEPPPTRRPKRR
jgi:curved DNA-binding protein CbpA